MGSLPLPPQIPNFGGPQPFQGYNAPPTQTQTAPPNTGANLLQGINAFLEQYRKSKEQTRQDAMGEAQQHIQNLLLGLPVDLKKTAAAMKRAGMDLDFESTAPPVSAPGAAQPQTPGQPITGAEQPTQAAPSGAPPTAPTQPPQGFWDRVKSQYLGDGGQINPASPGMAALAQLKARGVQTSRIEAQKGNITEAMGGVQQQEIRNESQKQAIVMGALAGNPAAVDSATRLGVFKDLPGDELMRMGRKAGMTDDQTASAFMKAQFGNTKLLETQIGIATEMKKYFDEDLSKSMKYVSDVFTQGKSDLIPSNMSVADRMNMVDLGLKIQKEHPSLPMNVANAYALTKVSGDEQTASKIANLISDKFPTAGDIDWRKWTAGHQLDLQKFQQSVTNFNKEYELNVTKAVREAMGSQFDEAMKLMENKDATEEEKSVARTMITDALLKKGSLDVKLPSGQKMNLGPTDLATRVQTFLGMDKWSGNLEISRQAAAKGDIATALGALTTPPKTLGPTESKNWREELQKRLKDLNILGAPEASGSPGMLLPSE